MIQWRSPALEAQISEWIESHKQELLADIAGLVQIPSVASYDPSSSYPFGQQCAQAVQYVLSLGQRHGFNTMNRENYCAVISMGDEDKRSVGIWGHVDVVPAGEGWIYPAFQATQKDDFLIGRGVQDNKGAVIAVLYALRFLKEQGITLSYHLQQIIGSGEEIGMHDVAYYRKHYAVPDFNIVADSGFPVCYGEKGMLSVLLGFELGTSSIVSLKGGVSSNSVPGYAGLVLQRNEAHLAKLSTLPPSIQYSVTEQEIKLEAWGKSGHAAFPQGTSNAIANLLQPLIEDEWFEGTVHTGLQKLHDICRHYDGRALHIQCEDELSGPLTCVGTIVNVDYGSVELELNIRYPIKQSAQTLLQKLTESGLTLNHVTVSEPSYCDPNTPEVERLMSAYQGITGEQREPFVMGGGTYARKLTNAVGFGPGLPADFSELGLPQGHGHIHGPDEVQSIPNLMMALKIYIMALLELNEYFC